MRTLSVSLLNKGEPFMVTQYSSRTPANWKIDFVPFLMSKDRLSSEMSKFGRVGPEIESKRCSIRLLEGYGFSHSLVMEM